MIESTSTYQQAADLAKSGEDLAVFFFDPACELCAGFIPEASKLLSTIIEQVHIVNARQSPFPPSHLPCAYFYRKGDEVPLVRVGVGPIDVIENDFRKFFRKI